MKRLILKILPLLLIIPCSSCATSSSRNFNNDESKNSAIFTIFTFDGQSETKNGIKNLGHSFVSIKNATDTPIYLVNRNIDVNEELCFGTWCIEDHKGIWCNLEPNYIKYYGRYDGRISLSFSIDLSDIDKIEEYVNSHDYWTATKNCSYFALNLYNALVSDDNKIKTPTIYNPTYLAKQLKRFNNYQTNRELNTTEIISKLTDETFTTYTLSKEGDQNE